MAQAKVDQYGNPIDPNDPVNGRNALTDQMGADSPPTNTTSTTGPLFTPTPKVTAPTTGSTAGPATQNTTADQNPTTPLFTPNAATTANQTFVHPGSIAGVGNIADPASADAQQRLSSALASYPNDPQQAIAVYMQNPANAGLGAKWYPDTKTIGLDNGTYLVAPGAGGNQSATWQVVQRGPEGGPGGGAIDTSGLNAKPDPFGQNIRDLLTSQMAGLTGPVDPSNANIAPEIAAYNTQSQRDEQSGRDRIAEEYYAMGQGGGAGLDSGSFHTATEQAREAAAGQRSNFTGSAVFQEAQARRSQLSDLLKTATTYGLTSQAQALQAEIAKIDAQLRDKGLTQQNSQFGDNLGFDYANLQAQLNRDAITAGLNG